MQRVVRRAIGPLRSPNPSLVVRPAVLLGSPPSRFRQRRREASRRRSRNKDLGRDFGLIVSRARSSVKPSRGFPNSYRFPKRSARWDTTLSHSRNMRAQHFATSMNEAVEQEKPRALTAALTMERRPRSVRKRACSARPDLQLRARSTCRASLPEQRQDPGAPVPLFAQLDDSVRESTRQLPRLETPTLARTIADAVLGEGR